MEGSPARHDGMGQTHAGNCSGGRLRFFLRATARAAGAGSLSCVRADGSGACIGQSGLGAIPQADDARGARNARRAGRVSSISRIRGTRPATPAEYSASKPVAEVEYLPYAIALEVREAWGDHLAEAFFATTIQR